MACEIEDRTRWTKPQENPMLITEDSKEISNKDNHIISKSGLDYSKFEHNNWMHQNALENKHILALNKKGAGIWISSSGNFYFRRSPNDMIQKLEQTKIKNVLCNILNLENINLFSSNKDEVIDIKRNELVMAEGKFTPFVNSEFYKEDGVWFRTSFQPSPYLCMTVLGEYPEPVNILWLIRHLCNSNEDYFKWVINWIACFFQTLEKSQVSLVLKGAQGTGKGLIFEILSKLFGKEFCVVIDDDRLGSNFKNWVSDTLFFNLNEIAHDMKGRKSVKNFIKMLVTDRSIQTEKKYENASVTEIFGNVLITSNENYPLEVEPSDRRFTVISTGKPLKKIGINTSELIEKMDRELEAFAVYLKSYPVDMEMYHTALDTPEKQAMIDGTTDRFTLFARAIAEKDISYFDILEDEKLSLFNELENDFDKSRICQSKIKPIYEVLFDEEIAPKTLFAKLRAVEPMMFPKDRKQLKKSNGEYYYVLP